MKTIANREGHRSCVGPRLLRGALAAAAILVAAQPLVAHAGGINESFDILHLRPFIGYEVSRVGTFDVQLKTSPSYKSDAFHVSGLAWGAFLGFRIGLISLDALYQRTDLAKTGDGRGVGMNKLYADLGFNLGSGKIRGVIDIGFGYSFLDIDGAQRSQGFGGRIGLSLDYFPSKWFSLGPTASFDAQGYNNSSGDNKSVVGAYGGTFTGRIGFHL